MAAEMECKVIDNSSMATPIPSAIHPSPPSEAPKEDAFLHIIRVNEKMLNTLLRIPSSEL
jgi:hypothetical protein